MQPPRKVIFLLVPLAILLLPLAIYWADRATSTEEIARNVSIAGVPVGGLSEPDAIVAVKAYEQELRQSTGVFTVNEETFKLSPMTVGLTANAQRAVNDAMTVRRNGNLFTNFGSWLQSFSTPEDVPLELSFSDDAIDTQLDDWEVAAIPNPAFEGAIEIVDGAVVPAYPRSGERIDRVSAHRSIVAELSNLDKAGATLAIVESTPTLTRADIDSAATVLALMIDSEVTLRSDEIDFRTTFLPDQLAAAARADVDPSGEAIDLYFDEDTIVDILEPRRADFELDPVDAQFDIDVGNDRIRVIPGRNGTLLDVEGLLVSLKNAALGDGTGPFPLLTGAAPAFTTQEAESYTGLELLASFTTTHPSGQDRVTNIQQMARDVDGSIVQPGREWSINDRVGQRTEDKGYVAAPAIINGEPYCCDHPANIGGGVSQFGTTLFNAVFYSCLEDVEHRPHSLSFDRYPKGIEATLGFPHPDVRFRNNTDAPVIIKTAYTSTSVTVKMYGDNGGKDCSAETSEDLDVVEFEEELVADEEGVVDPGERVKDRSGIDGFLVRVTRIVTLPDGSQNTDLELAWRYIPLTERYIVHPCEVTGEPIGCPVKLPSVTNATWDAALATLQEVGMLAAQTTESVSDAALDGVVLRQDPAAGTWVQPGATITLTVGVFDGSGVGDGDGDGDGDDGG